MREVSGIARAVACGAMLVVCSASRAGEKFPWRGFMLDEARHFFGKAAVIECLDEMKRNDLNVFHWHLTDDQGWRLDLRNDVDAPRSSGDQHLVHIVRRVEVRTVGDAIFSRIASVGR